MKNFRKQFQKQIQPRKMKIMIGIPSTGMVHVDTMLSVIGILNSTPNAEFLVQSRTGCYIEQNRHELIRIAIEQNCEKLLFLDSDMVVESGVVNKLLALNKPVVGAAYNGRKLPLYSNVKMADENGNLIAVPAEEIPKEPFKCFGVPTGCMLLDVKTVARIPKPWFDLTYHEDGSLEYGEDIYFCKKLGEYGVEVWCYPTIQIGHIGTFMY